MDGMFTLSLRSRGHRLYTALGETEGRDQTSNFSIHIHLVKCSVLLNYGHQVLGMELGL